VKPTGMDWGTALDRLFIDPGDERARAWAAAAIATGSGTPGQRHAYQLALDQVDVIDALEQLPRLLRGRLPDPTLHDVRPAPGEWTVRQLLAHLADNEMVNGIRIRSVLTEEEPVLFGYDSDPWTRFFELEDADAALRRLESLRANTVKLVLGLSPAELSRRGLISYRGPESLRVLLAVLAGHDRDHLEQLEATVRSISTIAGAVIGGSGR
jgi:DinB family protein